MKEFVYSSDKYVLTASHVLGAALSPLYTLSHVILTAVCDVGIVVIIPLSPKEVNLSKANS